MRSVSEFVQQFNDAVNNRHQIIVGQLDVIIQSEKLDQDAIDRTLDLVKRTLNELITKLINVENVPEQFRQSVARTTDELRQIEARLSNLNFSLDLNEIRRLSDSIMKVSFRLKRKADEKVKPVVKQLSVSSTALKKNTQEPLHLRILIVDDNLINQKLLARYLSQMSCEYETAQNGQEAVDKYHSGFDVVLMDVDMPVMNGLEATRQIVTRFPQAKILGLSAGDYEQEALRAGMLAFMNKPYQFSTLHDVLLMFSTHDSLIHRTPSPPVSLGKNLAKGALFFKSGRSDQGSCGSSHSSRGEPEPIQNMNNSNLKQ